jgi:hypothetical protein
MLRLQLLILLAVFLSIVCNRYLALRRNIKLAKEIDVCRTSLIIAFDHGKLADLMV